MKKKILLLTKLIGFALFYSLILVASVFLTMSILIKGEELKTPDLKGKSLSEAYQIASENGIYLKKVVGNYGRQFKPLTVINQFPLAGVKIKEKSFIKVFITSELVEVIMPELSTGYSLKECENILRDSDLRKRFISYMESDKVPVDFVISQSVLPGTRVSSGSQIDLLVSRGPTEKAYIMPDLIEKREENVIHFFENKGLKISQRREISYPGLEPGIIIKQHPDSGFKINTKSRISITVSQ
ncbi:MAG: PASTA domain-containing protein [bacterium]|nr:PASTA domain-containing protein [bacterium]